MPHTLVQTTVTVRYFAALREALGASMILGGAIVRQRSNAARRHCSKNAGSRLRSEIARTVSSSSPGGSASDSTSVTKPWR